MRENLNKGTIHTISFSKVSWYEVSCDKEELDEPALLPQQTSEGLILPDIS